MDEATYAMIPETLTLRELRFQIVEPGRRTQTIEIITTLTNPEQHTARRHCRIVWISLEFGIDIRSIKSNLNLAHVRCKNLK
ncbi:MAG: hypothetical protein KF851_04320 [Pirellulaceae bacterium]|nr:hypothetical protein [Pirellulaceae bacterium]